MGKNARDRAARKALAKVQGRQPEPRKPRLVILWGLPGSGKSWYARWLQRRKSFLHVDTDALQGRALDAGWFRTFNRETPPEEYMAMVVQHGGPVAVEFGLWATPQNIALLARMRDAGAEPWFFHGDRTAAKEAWRRENRLRQRNFEDSKWDQVVHKMDDNWGLIVDVVGENRMLRTIEAAERMTAEVIYDRMEVARAVA